ncbi:HAMP domain-containing sensor histidine kinase [Actinomadura sp. NAK00032]|uniref:sensor histidine kinase n=1 Tax=Actinomadura sp. NAK00032 TaxID=2742128 RepID=UPI0020C7F21A|nr:sensor histidine kinase [Actinomadura sp. NAK00032]
MSHLSLTQRGWDRLDLADVVKGALARRRDQAVEQGINIAEHLTPAVTAGDPKLLESLVTNLIDNAIRYNHAGGHVEVTTRTSGTQAVLRVTNSGPVVPGDQIPRLFHPFQRLAPDRHGRRDSYGLGLAIVNAVVRAHHATLTANARAEGGLDIDIWFGSQSA